MIINSVLADFRAISMVITEATLTGSCAYNSAYGKIDDHSWGLCYLNGEVHLRIDFSPTVSSEYKDVIELYSSYCLKFANRLAEKLDNPLQLRFKWEAIKYF